jgi:hypothetical protein
MKLISEKYRKLKPTIEHLGDEVVMAQAWKKTHNYMRRHNWYADTLALDISALGLEKNVKSWANEINGNAGLYPIELIPAAKSEKWTIDEEKGWVSLSQLNKTRLDKPAIRPLAHLTVRDQTWATAAMLCLADSVESAQGEIQNNDFFKTQKNKAYSYGNRLVCDWNDESSWFRWGNSETYRKFYTDYQAFLKRPIVIGRSVAFSHTDEDHVFVINLDLSRFYDCIDRDLLIERLRKLSDNFYDIEADPEFWRAFKKITDWKWRDEDQITAKQLGMKLGEGLPQGLVSAGFFANAYLLQFDSKIGDCIGMSLTKNDGVVLHDYCRYVDDIRLVVSVDDDTDSGRLSEIIYSWLSKKLKKYGGESLNLNPQKTQVTCLADLDNSGTLSERINSLQSEISGPADRDTLVSVMGVLEGLLTVHTAEIPTKTNKKEDLALLQLARFDHDVSSDTLKRFAANRLESAMRNRRKMGGELSEHGDLIDVSLDNESELLAKKLIWAWMQDPSLGLVLRKALEIFPSPLIAEPVFEAIFRRSSVGQDQRDVITTAQSNYLLADLFRSCVDFHGYFQRIDYAASADPEALLNLAARYAQKAVASDDLPDFIQRQALLLLAVMRKPANFSQSGVTIQHSLHAILAGQMIKYARQRMALFEVAAQITGDLNGIATHLLEHLNDLEEKSKHEILDEFAKRGGEFWFSIWKQLKKDKANKGTCDHFRWAAPVIVGDSKTIPRRLSKLIASNKNGFVHEAGMLKLALALLNGILEEELALGLSPNEIDISQKPNENWGEFWKPDVSIKCSISKLSDTKDPRYVIPDWICSDLSGAKVIYWIGTILRSAVAGVNDFTGNSWKTGKVVGYKGLRTGWFKRRMGMMHAPEVLVGEFATLSDWSAELLMKCLQWPGFESTYLQHEDIQRFENLSDFEKILKERLKLVDSLYCKASDMPALITRVKRPKADSSQPFRLVTVQQLLPRTSDFSKADPFLNSPITKARNRSHLAKICQLTYKTLTTKLQADDEKRPCADLIIFPEVGIHPDDQDLIKRLADKTKSMILAGLVFTDYDGSIINVARWFIPDYREYGRQWIVRDQGKQYPTAIEKTLGVVPFRPCQHIIELDEIDGGPFKITGSICYDATDLKLASDLKNMTDLFVIVAHNKDVTTFDTLASALHYHMYQHVALVNKGEFGGSTIQAPYKEQYDRLISHAHGVDQISINVADLDLAAFKRKLPSKHKKVKTKPAG